MTCALEIFKGCSDQQIQSVMPGADVTFSDVQTFKQAVCGEIEGCEMDRMGECEAMEDYCE